MLRHFRHRFTHIPAYSDISRHIQPGIIRHIQANSEHCVTLTYSEPSYIQKLGKFRTRGIFRTLVYSEPWFIQNPDIFKAYSEPWNIQNSEIFRTLVYAEPWQIENQRCIQKPGIFRTLAY